MDPQIRIFANRFILNLSAAVERSGLSVLRPAFPESDAQLIRSAYESRAREQPADDETLEIESSSPQQRTTDDGDDGSKFLAEYTTFAWDASSCEDEAESMVTLSDTSSPATPIPSLPATSSTASHSSDLPSLFNVVSEELPSLPPRPPSPLRRKPGRKTGQLDYLEGFVRSIPSKGRSRTYQCVICMHTAERKHDVKRHVASHDCVPDPYICYGCNKHFKRTERRARHWSVHPDCKLADEKISAELKDYNTRHGRRRRLTNLALAQ